MSLHILSSFNGDHLHLFLLLFGYAVNLRCIRGPTDPRATPILTRLVLADRLYPEAPERGHIKRKTSLTTSQSYSTSQPTSHLSAKAYQPWKHRPRPCHPVPHGKNTPGKSTPGNVTHGKVNKSQSNIHGIRTSSLTHSKEHPWQSYPWQKYPWQTFQGQTHPGEKAPSLQAAPPNISSGRQRQHSQKPGNMYQAQEQPQLRSQNTNQTSQHPHPPQTTRPSANPTQTPTTPALHSPTSTQHHNPYAAQPPNHRQVSSFHSENNPRYSDSTTTSPPVNELPRPSGGRRRKSVTFTTSSPSLHDQYHGETGKLPTKSQEQVQGKGGRKRFSLGKLIARRQKDEGQGNCEKGQGPNGRGDKTVVGRRRY